MGRTWLSVVTAAVLVAAALAMLFGRRYALTAEDQWRVTLVVEGDLTARDAAVTTLLPLDFRQQHLTEETFQSDELKHRLYKRKDAHNRRVVWRRRPSAAIGPQPFHLTYTFHCTPALWAPTPAMARLTRQFDAAPADGSTVRPAPRIESSHDDILRLADELSGAAGPRELVRAFFDHVAGLPTWEPNGGNGGALACLQQGGGDAAGKARLLVALCRSRGVPARIVSGLVFTSGREQKPHTWAEAWVEDRWLPACPTFGYFGEREFPEEMLVLAVGDAELVRSRGARLRSRYLVEHVATAAGQHRASAAARSFFRKLSLVYLRPVEQHVVKFLLLLPAAALIVSFFRIMIGVPTFGTFGPALLGLAFLDLRALPFGLTVFVLTLLLGWGLRRLLDRFHLLLVARVAALLTLIVVFLIVGVALASRYGVPATQYVALFPLVILTHMVERFWTLEAEDSTTASFKTLLSTVLVTVVISLALCWDGVARWLFHYPETLGLVLAGQLLLGRYTGYRLSELYRFHDLIIEDSTEGKSYELAGAVPPAESAGRAGHEPAQRGVHPGPQPPGGVSARGPQAADA